VSVLVGRMTTMDDDEPRLTRTQISAAVEDLGWRLVLGTVRTAVVVRGLGEAAEVAHVAAEAAGTAGDNALELSLQGDRVGLAVQSRALDAVTGRDLALVQRLTEALSACGWRTVPDDQVQLVEVAIDALDIPAVRPFWQAVLGYEDQPGSGPGGGLLDPARHGPAVWFQQMDAPRPQRNRIHLDVSVPHDQLQGRLAAALEAGGRLLSDESAPAFWVLADAEGNEACLTTWQGRDPA
jgi:4a-hydroxytetrahydrobiopterin dehydratase